MKTFYASLFALGICLGLTFPAMAEYPAKPIMLMTAFNAGGGSDLSHRLIEKFAKGVTPQPIVVTYKAGAAGGNRLDVADRCEGGRVQYRRRGSAPYRAPAPCCAPRASRATKRNSLIRFAASYSIRIF